MKVTVSHKNSNSLRNRPVTPCSPIVQNNTDRTPTMNNLSNQEHKDKNGRSIEDMDTCEGTYNIFIFKHWWQ